MNHIYKLLAIALIAATIIQWLGVGERIYHALWQWYKFKDYDGNGHTTISYYSAALVYVLSCFLVMASIYLSKCNGGKIVNLVGKFTTVSLIIGVLSLSILLFSPLAELVQR